MKPSFALNLSHDGISLLLRQSDESWLRLGEVALDSPDLAGSLARLREMALSRVGQGFTSLLVLPSSQLLFTTVTLGDAPPRDTIRAALDGRTPYSVDDLSFDWVTKGNTAQVAVVALETLLEAESFANEHGFNPVAFTAAPAPGDFDGVPFLGETGSAETHLRGATLEPEIHPIRITETAVAAPAKPAPQPAPQPPAPEPAPKPEPAPAPAAPPKPAAKPTPPAAPSFSSRRTDTAAPTSAPGENLSRLKPRIGGVTRPAGSDAIAPPPPAVAPPTLPPQDDATLASRTIGTALTAPPPPPAAAPAPPAKTPPTPAEDEAMALTLPGVAREKRSSFRLGLWLTLALLLALIAVAVWSVFALPSGTVSSLFGRGDPASQQTASLPAAPTTVPDAQILLPSSTATPDQADPTDDIAPLFGEDEESSDIASDAADTIEDLLNSYAETGVWQIAPDAPATVPEDELDALYVASIDPMVANTDAVALPGGLMPDDTLAARLNPPPAGSRFDVDARGLVLATPEGALTPEGVRIFAGRPDVEVGPLPRPADRVIDPNTTDADAANRLALASIKPTPRPTDFADSIERARNGGLTNAELASIRPTPRPESAQAQSAAIAAAAAAAASLATPDDDDTEVATTGDNGPASDLAIARSRVPAQRPADFAQTVEQARAAAPAAPARQRATASAAPTIPASASVARAATQRNVLALNRVNLIGVFGKPSNRQALVRLRNGRTVKVAVGDRIDGGRVTSIGDGRLSYRKSGRDRTLEMPRI